MIPDKGETSDICLPLAAGKTMNKNKNRKEKRRRGRTEERGTNTSVLIIQAI